MTTRRHVHFNSKAKSWTSPEPASTEAIDRFHQSLPNYEPTPLVSLDNLAQEIGVGAVHVKDETNRFGLPAFKILGASWGAFRSITEKFGLPLDSAIDTVREAAKSHQLTLYAATEGNHGRAVARMGAIFDISAEIHVPASMHPSTVRLIESEGAKVVMSKGRYEDAMLEAESASKHDKGIMVQDHAFGDYQTWIVDGYGTMMREVDKKLGSTKADLVIAPVGVGSFAQAVVSHFKRRGTPTSTLTVEPDTAACLWKSLERGEFTEIPTTGTIMAGLNCGAPSTIAWDVLKNGVDASLTISDYEAHQSAMYLQSQGINAGPCGASTLAALRRLTPEDKKTLRLNEKSTVVIFCTERNRDYDVPHDVSGNDPVALTQTLVQINSASPDLGSVPGPGETVIARYVTAWFEHRDLETHWVEYNKGRPSVVGVVRGSGGGKSVMFNGHLDTVTIMGYNDDPLSGKIVDGRLYGRGSADMKGGVAAGMVALANAKKLGLRGDVIFTGVADEESLSKGTEDILRAGWRADAAVVSESTNLEINHAHKGYCHIEIKVYGLAAHGSRADLGIDAIANAGHFLVEFGKYVKRLQEGAGDETLGTGTAHASVISGGEEASSYPAQCTIIAERRTIPGETNEVVQKEFDDIIAKVAKEVTDFKAEAKIFFSRPPQFTAADHPFTKLVSGIVGDVTGKDTVIAGAPFWTDCALLAEKGIVPLLWGPKGEGFHGKEEFVHVKSIEQVSEGLVKIAAEFCALVTAWGRYKEDTNSVAGWLASTAKAHGYKPQSNETQTSSSGRLKGNARKQAKHKAAESNQETGQKYTVAIKDFVPMAEHIAAQTKPRIQVPGSFATTIDRVIYERSSFRRLLAERGVDVDETADQNHAYFVRVLQAVREALRPNMPKSAKDKVPHPNTPRSLAQNFGQLTVEEPSREFLNAPEVERPKQMAQDNTTYELEEQDTLDDALTVWHLLMVDAGKIRDRIAWVWKAYRDRKLDITVAGVATDTGIHMLAILEEQSRLVLHQHGGCLEVSKAYFSSVASQKGYSMQYINDCWNGNCDHVQLSELFNATFSQALTIVERLVKVFSSPDDIALNHTEMINKLKACWSVPGSNDTTLKLSVDQLMATQFWNASLVHIAKREVCGPLDKFSGYVLEACHSRKIHFVMAFATQMQLDIFYLLQGDLFRSSLQVQTHLKDMRDQLRAVITNLSRSGSPRSSRGSISWLEPTFKRLDSIAGYYESENEQKKQSEGPFAIFEIMPAFSGLYLFQGRELIAMKAMSFAKDVMTIMAHAYNAMMQVRILKVRWPDMEALEKCFEERDLFFAGKPVNLENFTRHLLLTLGVPLSAMRDNRIRAKRKPPREFFKAFFEGAPGTAPVSSMFNNTIFKCGILQGLSWDDLDYLISVSFYKDMVNDDGTHKLVSLDIAEKKKLKERMGKPKSKHRQQSKPCSPDEKLRQFTLALAGESRELAFPYMEMYNLFTSLFDKTSDRCTLTLEGFLRGPDSDKGNHFTMLQIISLASQSHQYEALREAADEIQKHISSDPTMLSKRIADVPDFDGAVIPEFESYKVPAKMFVHLSMDTKPEDELIILPLEAMDSAPGKMEEDSSGHSPVDPSGSPPQMNSQGHMTH
ncbi:diaminopropionate ammonia-lyase [Fusarium coicis]|nr:diaminopropionate ammonia-lyase [Fusarium coicis]